MRKFFSATIVALMVLLPSVLQAKVEHLLPRPQQVTVTEGSFDLGRPVTISYLDGAAKCELLEEFFTSNGCTIAEGGAAVNVSLVASIEGAHDYELYGYENEAYTLEITAAAINITAVTATGIIRAAQTLTQLAEGYEGAAALETLTMKDWPAFKLRGYMHDVGRSFISADELVKQVELFSRFKVNTFHWHMTENQAWRFEVKAYPKLTSDESMTRFPGQYYTQEDCKKVLDAAKKHGMIVVPEIDMPGHSEAFERAMGFNMQSEEGKVVLKKVLDEVCTVFADAPYIHIGGDEVSTTAAYLNEMIAYVESKGKKAELWNPINGIGQDALNHTLAQMWGTRGYLAPGKANIDCRYNYTNHFDVFADLVGIYKSNIYYHDKGTPEVAGAVSGCWNDRKVADEVQIMAQNNVWANVIATAERAWIGGGKQYIDNMTNTPDNLEVDGGHGGVMLPNSGEEFEEFASWERRFLFHKANSLKNEPIPYVKQTNVRWRITDAFPNNGNPGMSFAPEAAGTSADANLIAESFVHEGKTYYTGMATGAGIYLSHTWGNSIIDAYYSNPQFNHTAYAWTFVYSDKEQTVGAQIEFQNYSRSEQDGAAPAGKWDHFDSRIWLNGVEIPAPVYENTGVSVSSKEVMLKNENFPARKPIEVTLKQGWNKVFLKLPYMNTGYRLKKWMFTFVLTDVEGKNAVDGLIYSPNQFMDEATESVASKISEIKRDRGAVIGTAVGLWPESLAATLDAKVAEVEATCSANKTAEERAAQVAELEAAWVAFEASLADANMNKPVSGNYYRMFTPLRENRYPTSKGAGNAVVGEQNATSKSSIWQFVTRTDGAYNIINLADGTYLSPASNNNAALKTVAAEPNAGWSVKKAATNGLVIVVSGSVQFNQQKDGNLHLLNWGSGTNTTDTGCQYLFTDVNEITLDGPDDFVNGEIYFFETERGVLGAVENNGNLVSSAKTSFDSSKSNPYCQWTVYKTVDNRYYLYNIGKGMFMGATTANNGSIPFETTPTSSGLVFKETTKNGYPIMFTCNTDAGAVNHSSALGTGVVYWGDGWDETNDAGNCHKVTKIGELDAETLASIKMLVGDVETRYINSAADFKNGEIYTFVSKRGWLGAKEDNGNVISTAYTANGVTGSETNAYFQWTVYKYDDEYYLYNIGKKMFMGVQAANNAAVPFVSKPTANGLTFKVSSNAEYPVMFSTDNNGVINHSANHNPGLINWTGGWNTLNDDGSNHKVKMIATLDKGTLASIEALVAAVNTEVTVSAVVEGYENTNPNTHFGGITFTCDGVAGKKTLTTEALESFKVKMDVSGEVALAYTREYRGFDFLGFFLDGSDLGLTPTLTAEQKEKLVAGTPLVVKFKTDGTKDVTLFYDDDPKSYRIPAIATTGTGRLIAVSDYRYSLDDIGRDNHGTGSHRIDLVIRTSDDNGATWSGIQTIAQGTDVRGANDCAYGDAAIAAVGEKVLVMAAAGDVVYGGGSATAHNRMVRLFSDDNGVTWSKEDISDKVFIGENAMVQNGYTAFFGSGKLAVDANYNNTGNPRIYGAILIKNSSRSDNNYVIYSDDFGATWSILGGSPTPVAYADEPKVEILPSGQILLSTRRSGGRKFNVFTYTDKATNEGNWGSAVDGCGNGGSNTTNGEIFCVDAKNVAKEPVKLLLQSQPKGGSGLYDRRNVTIWYKEITAQKYTSSDIAANWIEGKQVSTQLSAYSTMSLQQDGNMAFFFEEAPCYGDDHTKGYSMVYLSLPLEVITNGNYYGVDAVIPDFVTVDAVLTDANGNEFHETLESAPSVSLLENALAAKYPYITLGTNGVLLPGNNGKYTYTNTVTLPFEVSNAETTVWHNIYWPSNGNNTGYPVYMSASSASDEFVPKVTENQDYGNSSYNTLGNNDKISWAVYNVNNGFAFKFKNKLTNKFIQVTNVANGNAQNVKYVDEANATAFTLLPDAASYHGDFALVASVGETEGYLCSSTASYGYATHHSSKTHQGAWVKFNVVPDFAALIEEIENAFAVVGEGVGKFSVTEANKAAYEAAKEAMQNSENVKLNALNGYKALVDGAVLNMPEAGKYYRIAYDYGGNAGKLYMQSVTSGVKGLQFAAEQGAGSIWCYNDGALLSYTEGKYIKEHGDYRGLQPVGTKQDVEFSASTRAKGKYCIKLGSFLHANASNGNYFTDHCSGNGCAQHDFVIEEVTSLPVAITSIEYATLYASVALQLPEGVKAHTFTVNGKWLDLSEGFSVVPANTGVLLSGSEGLYDLEIVETDAVVESILEGSVAATVVEGDAYILSEASSVVGFYRVKKELADGTAFLNNSHKAYLPKSAVSAVAESSFFGLRGEDEETAVEDIEVEEVEAVYDLAGRKVKVPGKGIYIVNGEKKIIK